MYDIGIIGGGTAGLTAAIYGQRAGKRTLVIEGLNFGGQIVNSPKVENYPGLESISGSQYSMNLLNQAMKLGAETASERVKEVREENGIKIIVTDQKEYPCKAVDPCNRSGSPASGDPTGGGACRFRRLLLCDL